jgi:hypothetical protein
MENIDQIYDDFTNMGIFAYPLQKVHFQIYVLGTTMRSAL